jgi:hypothetical protein
MAAVRGWRGGSVTEVEVSHLMRETSMTVSVTMCGGVLWHSSSWCYQPGTMHGISVCISNISAITVLNEVMIELVSRVLRVGDRSPRICVSTWVVGRQLVPTVTMADNLTLPAVEATVDECHVRGVIDYLSDSRLMMGGERMERRPLCIQRVVDGLYLEKVVSIFSRTRCSMTLLVGPLYIRAARGSLECVVCTFGILPVLLRRRLRASWDGDGDHNRRRERGNSKRPAQLHR